MATTANRVSAQTPTEINRHLRWEMEKRLAYYETHPDQIPTRLEELDREWDIERTLEANASTLAFTGTMLAATVDRRWLALPAIVTGFLFQHAMQGWCPPLPILRRLGFRTAEEINQERYALKALKGDFDVKGGNKLDTVLRAVGIR
ncbi:MULTISPECIES: hypothetical protein [Rhizobiaceae]|jgi:hypothetical protein|uniref:DUF2892 domain-containing protein n=1 Tax=Agrobacterium tumefaciens TaxID=358 RepID=A0AAE6BV30_AGRTU|nr:MULTISPECIES: hypothetical protein [Rhizobiaceae]KNY31835.1 hypothetical protein AKG12_22865 [Agrobacterium sp. SUL3]KRA61964.1 hypothetical protein ASD85_27050 [Rhizobium sp. Root651]MCA2372776.1 hypothetical protein [Agrobacterium tomkonis CIP 111-78]MDH0117588.1 hypothetical protein [Agrobacterium pusense]MDH2092221.1 hypothetical protein [Agrobacterium pusense]